MELLKKQIKKASMIQAREHNRVKKGMGLVAGALLAGSFFLASPVALADEMPPSSEAVATSGGESLAVETASAQTPEATEIITPVESSTLDASVNEARKTGVTVENKEMITTDSFKEAKSQLEVQEDRVKEATVTQKEVDSVQANAEKEAKTAGVELQEGRQMIYKDQNREALVDANTQAGQLSEATMAQNQINESLPTVVKTSQDVGVSIVVEAGVKYENVKRALSDLAHQVASLETATKTQADLDNAIAFAFSEAKKSGVVVSLSQAKKSSDIKATIEEINRQLEELAETVKVKNETADQISHAKTQAQASGVKVTNEGEVSYRSVAEALADSKAQVENLAKASLTQKEANQILSDAKVNAAANDTTVRVTGVKEVTIDQAKAEAQKQAEKILAIYNENKSNEIMYQADLKAYEEEKKRLEKEYSDAIKTWETESVRIEAENKQKQAQYEADKQRIDQENATINAKNEAAQRKYQEELANYQSSKADYDQKVKEAEVNLGKDGYLNSVEIQKLIFRSEPNAVMTVSQPAATQTEINIATFGRDIGQFKSATKGEPIYILHKNSPIKVRYTSLENSFFENKQIGSVDFTYSLRSTQLDDQDKILVVFEKDPTRTVWYWNKGEETFIDMDISFYDKDGQKMDTTGSLISFSSLNSTNYGKDYEAVSDFNGQFLEINGSSIKNQNGRAASKTSNGNVNQGSKYPELSWDKDGSPLEYYGSIIGKTVGEDIRFTISSKGRNYVWFAFNTSLKTLDGGIVNLNKPTPPTPSPTKTPPSPALETAKPPKPEQPTPTVSPVKPTPKPVEIENVQVVASSHDINLSATVTPVTIEAKTHDITMLVPVHDVRIETSVAPIEVHQAPSNKKDVYNGEGLDINDSLIAKGSFVKWQLSNDSLKAGRDLVTEYKVTDTLPKGFTLDLKETAALSSDWTVNYAHEDHTVVFTLKDSKLFDINADVTVPSYIPVIQVVGKVINDGSSNENTFVTAITTAETVIRDEDGRLVPQGKTEKYIKTSNTVIVHTPEPSVPVKDIVLTKEGQSVDGKTLLPNAEVSYTYKWDLDQYKGVKLTEEDKLKGFALVGDLKDSTVSIDFANASLKTLDGKEVTGLELVTYHSLDEAKDEHKEILKEAGITPEGDFYMWIPTNPEDFATAYVETGKSIFVTVPVKAGDYTGTFTNKIWQVDMGNGYTGNVVENNIPKLEAIKEVIKSIGSNESNNNGLVEVGQEFPYVLDGAAINGNIVGGLKEYKIYDDFDERYDEYNAGFYAFADQNMKLADGTVIKKDEEISRYFTQELIRDEAGKVTAVEFSVDPQFLETIDKTEGIFDPRVYMMVKRIAHAETVENTYDMIINGYKATSNVAKTHTPEPSVPVKDIILTNTGQSVNGKTLLPNTEVSYIYKWDLDQYKGITLAKSDKQKAFALVGDLKDSTVSIDFANVSLKTLDGQEVTGVRLFTYKNLHEASEEHKAILQAAGISPEGDFYMWIPDDFESFATTYLETGTSILATIPVKTGDYTGTFTNKIWQIDFGKGYTGNIVENSIPKLEALKDAVKEIGSKDSLNNGTVKVGQVFPYVLDGPAINGNVAGGLTEYKFRDDFDERYDEYISEFYAFADQDIKLVDGTVIKKDEEISRYFTQELIRDEAGKVTAVEFSVDPKFLEMIDKTDGIFDTRVYMMVKRIAPAEKVENTVTVVINGFEIVSNTVVTHTPEPKKPKEETPPTPEPKKPEEKTPETPKPEAPKPVTPTQEVPKEQPTQAVLPNTGDTANTGAVLAGSLLLGFGLLGMAVKKKVEEDE